MIVVIADDLTGAAELAGIGLRYGLNVEMSTTVSDSSDADLLVVATDTRSMTESEAVMEIEKITAEVLSLSPELIYKKIDSVLRGHVIPELIAQLKTLDRKTALVIAANPSLERTIRDGNYFYKDQPIHLSSFSKDPEFGIVSPDVLQMLRTINALVKVKKVEDDISGEGIFIGEVSNEADLKYWANQVAKPILPAGGSDFFSAILDNAGIKKIQQQPLLINSSVGPALFVSGTTFKKSREAVKELKNNGGPVSYMPPGLMIPGKVDPEILQLWSNEILAFLHSTGKAIVAIDEKTVSQGSVSAKALRENMALGVNSVLQQIALRELSIEGGSTAAAIIRQAGFKNFIPTQELVRGVVRMRVVEKEDLYMTVKPGSYDWPAGAWDF